MQQHDAAAEMQQHRRSGRQHGDQMQQHGGRGEGHSGRGEGGDPTAAAAVGAHVRGDWADAERLYKQALSADRSVSPRENIH